MHTGLGHLRRSQDFVTEKRKLKKKTKIEIICVSVDIVFEGQFNINT